MPPIAAAPLGTRFAALTMRPLVPRMELRDPMQNFRPVARELAAAMAQVLSRCRVELPAVGSTHPLKADAR